MKIIDTIEKTFSNMAESTENAESIAKAILNLSTAGSLLPKELVDQGELTEIHESIDRLCSKAVDELSNAVAKQCELWEELRKIESTTSTVAS